MTSSNASTTYSGLSQPIRDVHTLQKELLGDVKDLRAEVDTMLGSVDSWFKIYSKLNDKFKVVLPDSGSRGPLQLVQSHRARLGEVAGEAASEERRAGEVTGPKR